VVVSKEGVSGEDNIASCKAEFFLYTAIGFSSVQI
jgi:hypothetical protein